jgi:hypothetical protein
MLLMLTLDEKIIQNSVVGAQMRLRLKVEPDGEHALHAEVYM